MWLGVSVRNPPENVIFAGTSLHLRLFSPSLSAHPPLLPAQRQKRPSVPESFGSLLIYFRVKMAPTDSRSEGLAELFAPFGGDGLDKGDG